jgi:release factor glutamine methyltransferase
MTTIKQVLLSTRLRLNNALEARVLLQHHFATKYEELLLNSDNIINTQDMLAIDSLVKRRLAKEPIAYITGVKEFYGLEFHVTKDTLIPRPDSETLINAVLDTYDHKFDGSIIDFGTGSGCLIITLLKQLPKATGIALDISQEALKIAKKNADTHNVINRLELINKSWNDLKNKQCDIIISNPPYIKTEDLKSLQDDVIKYEPKTALDGGTNGIDCYAEIFELSKTILKDKGNVFVEIGYDQEQLVTDLARKKGLVVRKNYQDLNKIVRCLNLIKPHQL